MFFGPLLQSLYQFVIQLPNENLCHVSLSNSFDDAQCYSKMIVCPP